MVWQRVAGSRRRARARRAVRRCAGTAEIEHGRAPRQRPRRGSLRRSTSSWRLLYEGLADVTVLNPGSSTRSASASSPAAGSPGGSLGYFGCGLIDGPEIHITGRVGWSACENMMSGVVIVDGNAGSLTAAAIRGDVVVKGGRARTGIDQKGARSSSSATRAR